MYAEKTIYLLFEGLACQAGRRWRVSEEQRPQVARIYAQKGDRTDTYPKAFCLRAHDSIYAVFCIAGPLTEYCSRCNEYWGGSIDTAWYVGGMEFAGMGAGI